MANTTVEKIVANMQKFLDKDVLILEPNSHAGQKGKTIRAEVIPGKKKPAMIVKLDNGKEIQIFNPQQLFFIVSEIRTDRIKDN